MKIYYWAINTALWLRIAIFGYGKFKEYKMANGTRKAVNYQKKDWWQWGSIQTDAKSASIEHMVLRKGHNWWLNLIEVETLGTPWSSNGEIPEPYQVPFAGSEVGQWVKNVKNYQANVHVASLHYGALHGFWLIKEGAEIKEPHEIDFEWMMNRKGKYALVCTVHRGGYGKDHVQVSKRYPLPKKAVNLRVCKEKGTKLYVNERLVFYCGWQMGGGRHCLLGSMYAVRDNCGSPQLMTIKNPSHDGQVISSVDIILRLPQKSNTPKTITQVYFYPQK